MKLFAILWSLLTLSAGLSAAATYYVAPDGDDTNPGTEEEPFREIREALDHVQPGDEVLVADGQYLGFNIVSKGSLTGEPITLRATGDNAEITVTTDRGKNDTSNIVVYASYNIIIDGFRSFGAATAGLRAFQCGAITVRNCTFGNHGYWGILTSHTADVVLEHNECYGSQVEHGIYVANSADNPVVRGNILHSNAGSGLRMNGDSYDTSGDGIITGALIENNVAYENGLEGGAALNLNNIQDATIRNNVVWGNYATGIALFKDAEAIPGPASIQIYHNTVDVPDNARYALRVLDLSGPVTVRNNIFYNRNPKKGPYSLKSPSDTAWVDTDYNLIASGLVVSEDDEVTDLTWPVWVDRGNDTHSQVIANPAALFVDLASRDYHLAPNSAAIDAGTEVSVPTDRDGATRPAGSAPDAGAYERHQELAGVQSFTDFKSLYYLDEAGTTEDSDQDQTALGIEYLLDLDPTQPDPAPQPSIEPASPSGVRVVYPVLTSRLDLPFRIEHSADLKSWSTLSHTLGKDGIEALHLAEDLCGYFRLMIND